MAQTGPVIGPFAAPAGFHDAKLRHLRPGEVRQWPSKGRNGGIWCDKFSCYDDGDENDGNIEDDDDDDVEDDHGGHGGRGGHGNHVGGCFF